MTDKASIETLISARFDEIFGPTFRNCKGGMKCYRVFRGWIKNGRGVLSSTLPDRRGLLALKCDISEMVRDITEHA